MGKKSFVATDYDPIGQALAVDEAKLAPKVAPIPPRIASPPVPKPKRQPEVGERVAPVQPKPPAKPVQSFEDDEVSKRIKVSRASFLDFEAMLARIHSQTGTQIPYSVATRLSWDLMTRAEAALLEELRKRPVGPLPSTKDKIAYAAFQEKLLETAATAYRKIPRTSFRAIPVGASSDDLDE